VKKRRPAATAAAAAAVMAWAAAAAAVAAAAAGKRVQVGVGWLHLTWIIAPSLAYYGAVLEKEALLMIASLHAATV
jgi:hypothetical protein